MFIVDQNDRGRPLSKILSILPDICKAMVFYAWLLAFLEVVLLIEINTQFKLAEFIGLNFAVFNAYLTSHSSTTLISLSKQSKNRYVLIKLIAMITISISAMIVSLALFIPTIQLYLSI